METIDRDPRATFDWLDWLVVLQPARHIAFRSKRTEAAAADLRSSLCITCTVVLNHTAVCVIATCLPEINDICLFPSIDRRYRYPILQLARIHARVTCIAPRKCVQSSFRILSSFSIRSRFLGRFGCVTRIVEWRDCKRFESASNRDFEIRGA